VFIDKFATPQLLIHGSRDFRLPETESLGCFNALQQCVSNFLLLFSFCATVGVGVGVGVLRVRFAVCVWQLTRALGAFVALGEGSIAGWSCSRTRTTGCSSPRIGALPREKRERARADPTQPRFPENDDAR
jgi:hypothetical protein